MSTLYELKTGLSMIGNQLKKVNETLMEKAKEPNTTPEEIKQLKEERANLEERFNILKGEHDKREEAEKQKLEKKEVGGIKGARNDKERMVAAKAEFYRAAIERRPMHQEAAEVLASTPLRTNPATTGGENFLPTNLTTELISEPFARNQLRQIIRMTNIKGLELPKIAYTVADDSFISDTDDGQPMNLTGDKVSFGRHKFKVYTEVSDSVIYGSDVNLVNWIDNALRSGLAAKEKKISFDSAPAADYEHMSFYNIDTGDFDLDLVTGEDLYGAITNAIAALHEDFRDNAKVVMRFADYVTMLKDLSNSAATLYNTPPEMVIGKPVVFTDSAAAPEDGTGSDVGTPIVGDFNYAHLNYDGQIVFDTDKDVKKGVYVFVITAWIDQHRLLDSAFRLAQVEPAGE